MTEGYLKQFILRDALILLHAMLLLFLLAQLHFNRNITRVDESVKRYLIQLTFILII